MHRGRSTNWFFSIPLLGLVQACSSDSDPAQQAWNLSDSDPTQRAANCISPDDSGVQVTPIARAYELVCALDGFPFALSVAAFSVNDASLRVTQPEADALCLSGAVSEKVPSWAGISLQFSARSADRTQVLSVLDLDARGITQLAFTLESAPSTGLMIEATTITSLSCPGDPRGCATPVSGFALMDGPGS
ncbi:MAG TPA: hypothetical protein VNN80_08435, partial [Polyangiaceae bacterium]|nr:hypothetical protein [Polyangiaceae bacterium]